MVGRAVTATVTATMELDEGTNSNVFAEVNVTGNGSYNVELAIYQQN